ADKVKFTNGRRVACRCGSASRGRRARTGWNHNHRKDSLTVVARQVEMETKNPERRGLRKGVYLIPSVFTAANIGMGFYAVMAAVRGFQFGGAGSQADLA